MPDPIRVVLVHNIVAPYRFPLFKALAQHSHIDLTVWFMSRTASNRRWRNFPNNPGFKYEVLPSFEIRYRSTDLFTYIVNYTFPWRYARAPFEVMISAGWLDFACQAGFVESKVLRRKFVLWSESTDYEPSVRRSLSLPVVRAMVRGADACVAVGARSSDYLRSLGSRHGDVFTAYSTVDVDFFRRVSSSARRERNELRASFGIRRSRVVLYCGQFIQRKGLRYLLEAFSLIKQTAEDVALVLVGYGPLQSAVRSDVRRLNLSDVHLLEHVEVAEMPKMYALADIFVLPSLEETWGLVVNEAMACSLPVVVTDRVGSSVDLVAEGRNGFVVPAADAASIADRALRLLTDEELLTQFSACSAERILHFTPERAADGFVRAIEHATGGK